MKIMVAGAGGFLAGHLVERLVEVGHSVRAVDLPGTDMSFLDGDNVEVLAADLTSPEMASKACDGVDVVVNSAALVSPTGSRERHWAINVDMVDGLLEAARRAGAQRFVQVSSPSAVFDGTDHHDVDESIGYPTRFLSHYSETKAESERRVLAANTDDLETVIVRPHAVWVRATDRSSLESSAWRNRDDSSRSATGRT